MHRAPALTVWLAILLLTRSGVGYGLDQTNAQQAVAAAGPYKVQAKTAAAHASFAAEGSMASYVREHLGHTVACIEGPRAST